MGRHVDPEDHSFRRSFLRAVGGGIVAMIVTAGVTFALTQLGGEQRADGPVVVRSPSPTATSPSPEPTPAGDFELPAQPTETAGTTEIPSGIDGAKSPEETTVQVLDGSGDEAAVEDAAETLRELGYNVVAINSAAVAYERTTVLASDGRGAEAEALRRRDDRFTDVGENTNLNPEVDLHVVVGADWPAS